jgi:hypothetical protein
MLIHGRCHCGNISYSLKWTPSPTEIPARACSCSFCQKHGGVWTSHPGGALTVLVKERAKVSPYAFGTRTALFHVCARCGAVPVVTSEIEGRTYAVVNIHTMEGVDPALFKHGEVRFDAEDAATRLARRARGWIGSVEFTDGDA